MEAAELTPPDQQYANKDEHITYGLKEANVEKKKKSNESHDEPGNFTL